MTGQDRLLPEAHKEWLGILYGQFEELKHFPLLRFPVSVTAVQAISALPDYMVNTPARQLYANTIFPWLQAFGT